MFPKGVPISASAIFAHPKLSLCKCQSVRGRLDLAQCRPRAPDEIILPSGSCSILIRRWPDMRLSTRIDCPLLAEAFLLATGIVCATIVDVSLAPAQDLKRVGYTSSRSGSVTNSTCFSDSRSSPARYKVADDYCNTRCDQQFKLLPVPRPVVRLLPRPAQNVPRKVLIGDFSSSSHARRPTKQPARYSLIWRKTRKL